MVQAMIKTTPSQMAFISEIKRIFKTEIVREYKFHPVRKWRIDYYLPEYGIAIEVEGGSYINGRHVRGEGFRNDIEKYNQITAAGLMLIRVIPQDLNKQSTFELIKQCIAVKNLSP